MYRISKEFKFEMAHRLSKHLGNCHNIHGHSYTVIVGLKSNSLDENGMIIDFSELKHAIENDHLNELDHALVLSEEDSNLNEVIKEIDPKIKIQVFYFEPTAEHLSKFLYNGIKVFTALPPDVMLDYVTVYETETSQATYSED